MTAQKIRSDETHRPADEQMTAEYEDRALIVILASLRRFLEAERVKGRTIDPLAE